MLDFLYSRATKKEKNQQGKVIDDWLDNHPTAEDRNVAAIDDFKEIV